MAHTSEPDLLVLHSLRLKGIAEPAVVAGHVELPEHEVERRLATLAGDGLVQRRDGRISGWSLTTTGRDRHASLVAEEVDVSGARDKVDNAYRHFRTVNGELLATCAAWQLREVDGVQVLNDHADPDHDAAVVERLAAAHERVSPVLDDLAAALERFSSYRPRLENALARVRAGEIDWFTKPLLDSYHSVWFELHEDLLVTLGIERGDEGKD